MKVHPEGALAVGSASGLHGRNAHMQPGVLAGLPGRDALCDRDVVARNSRDATLATKLLHLLINRRFSRPPDLTR